MEKKNAQIEGLRGIGCLMVVFFHLTYRYCGFYQNGFEIPIVFTPIKYFGTYGVLLFFVISFFLRGNKQTKENIFVAYFKQYYHLIIPYIISITITFACEQFMNLSGQYVDFKTYLVNLTMFQTLFGFENVDGAHWYLYTLLILTAWILIIEKMPKYRVLLYFAFLLMVEGLTYFHKFGRIIQPDFASVAVFVIMIKYLHDYYKEQKNVLLPTFVAICAFGCTIIHHGLIYSSLFLLIVAIFLLCYYKKLKFIQNSVLVYVGSLSFYIYLIHQNISYMIINLICEKTGEYHLWYLCICIPVIWGISIVIKKLTDKCYKIKRNKWR